MIYLIPLYLALASRWHGSHYKAPKQLKNLAWALPFAVVTWLVTHNWVTFAIVLVTCMIGKTLGHGAGIDLGTSTKSRGTEKAEYLIVWLRGKISEYWYDVLFMCLVGLLAVAGCAVVIGTVNLQAGALIAIGGAAKGVAYMFGWTVYSRGSGKGIHKELDEATEIGEFLTGLLAGLALISAYIIT